MFNIQNTSDNPEIISAKTLRITIGILGFLISTILAIGAWLLADCEQIQNSISAYYHTIMRNFFVGAICAVAICLFAYRGYSRIDVIAGRLAALFALGIAWFPTSVEKPFTDCITKAIDTGILGKIHLFASALFFLLLAFFSIVLFTKSKGTKTRQKIWRNRIFKTCGYIMLICIALIALYFLFLQDRFPALANYRPVFYLEAIALIAFSISWLVKGEVILRDE